MTPAARFETTEYLVGLLHELCSLPVETEWVEFKCNKVDPYEIGRNISALANSAALCGKTNAYIVWGISDESHDVVGTDFTPSTEKKGNEALENWLLRLLNPQVNFRFREFDRGGKRVSLVEIPRATHRPLQFQGVEYIRIGSYTKTLKDHPERERQLWKTFDETPFEKRAAVENVSATEVLSLLNHQSYFDLLHLPVSDGRNHSITRLAEETMICRAEDGGWNITNLGAILLARNLNDFSQLARKIVRVVEYDGDGRIRTKREFPGQKGYASGFEELIGLLKGMLPENEVIKEARRTSVPMYPELAIRELVANLIIHQDFTPTGTGPMIEIFDMRIEFTNPGVPLIDTRRFLDIPPRSRNEGLASFLRRAGICEERGSGVDKIVSQTEFYQLPAPVFEVVGEHTRAVLFAHKPFSAMDKTDRTRACYLHACLQFVERKQLTNASLRRRFGIDEKNRAQVTRVIGDAVDEGLVKPFDPENASRKHAKYVPFWA